MKICEFPGCIRTAHHELGGFFICHHHEDRFYQYLRSKARKMQKSTDLFAKNKFYGRKVDIEALDN